MLAPSWLRGLSFNIIRFFPFLGPFTSLLCSNCSTYYLSKITVKASLESNCTMGGKQLIQGMLEPEDVACQGCVGAGSAFGLVRGPFWAQGYGVGILGIFLVIPRYSSLSQICRLPNTIRNMSCEPISCRNSGTRLLSGCSSVWHDPWHLEAAQQLVIERM